MASAPLARRLRVDQGGLRGRPRSALAHDHAAHRARSTRSCASAPSTSSSSIAAKRVTSPTPGRPTSAAPPKGMLVPIRRRSPLVVPPQPHRPLPAPPNRRLRWPALYVEHVDGTRTETAFPDLVAPHQPFARHSESGVGDTTPAASRCASRARRSRPKTSATGRTRRSRRMARPSIVPRPVQVAAGDHLQQRIEILIEPARTLVAVAEDKRARPRARRRLASSSPVGLGMAPAGHSLTPVQHELLRVLGADHLRADVRPDGEVADGAGGWPASRLGLRLASVQASIWRRCSVRTSTVGLERPRRLRDAGVAGRRAAGAWQTMPDGLARRGRSARNASSMQDSRPTIGAGTNRYFAELNRNRPPRGTGALPVFSLNPQVHAFDELSIMENLEALPWMVAPRAGSRSSRRSSRPSR
jgi:D-apionolactonase